MTKSCGKKLKLDRLNLEKKSSAHYERRDLTECFIEESRELVASDDQVCVHIHCTG